MQRGLLGLLRREGARVMPLYLILLFYIKELMVFLDLLLGTLLQGFLFLFSFNFIQCLFCFIDFIYVMFVE